MTNPEQREKIARDEAIVECLRAIVWTEARTTYQDYWFAKGKEALVAYDAALAAIIALDPAPESAK